MILTRDYFNQIEVPQYVLCKANGEFLGEINCVEQKGLSINDINEINFTVYKYMDGLENDMYDLITEMKYVQIPNQYKFVITSVTEEDDGVNPKKNVTAQSAEVNLGQRYLEEFYINTGEDYAINGVKLYDPNDESHSLLNLVLQDKCPDWTIKYVSPTLMNKERYFEVDRNDIYSFLTNEVSEAFEAVVVFDGYNQWIYVYDEDSYGEDTNIYVTYDNLLQNTSLSSSVDEIKTCMTVIGSDDLNLREVNMGSDKLYMFDYYMTPEFVSQGLCDAYYAWKAKVAANKATYNSCVNQVSHLYEEINYLTNEKMPKGGANLLTTINGSASYNGITFTVDQTNKTITLNGTANDETEFVITDNLQNILTDDTLYRFIGCPLQDQDNIKYYIQWYDKDDPTTKDEQNSIDSGAGNSKRYYSGYNRLSIFVHDGVELDNVVFEPNIYLPDSKDTDWTKYGLVPLQEQLASYKGQQAVMIKAGQAETSSPDYQTMYLPVFNAINAIEAQIVVVSGQLETLNRQVDLLHEQMSVISSDCSMNNNFTESQIIELSKFIREDSINSDNYVITDEMNDADRVVMLQDMIEYGEKELRKVSQPQIQFNASLVNLFNMEEFDDLSVNFKKGNYIHVILRDDYVVKARILSMDIDFFDMSNISVTFGNVNKIKGKTLFTDISRAINTANSVSTTVSVKSSYWNAANKDVNEINSVMDSGYVSANRSIKTSSADVEINDNGILLTSTDANYPNDRILIGGSRILFSDDNLESVKEAVGRIQYTTRDGVEHDEFGVLAQFVIAGYINGTTIDGGTLNVGGAEDGKIVMYDANGVECGRWDKNGIILPANASITWGMIEDAPDIPENISDLNNDSDFASISDIPTEVSELDNDSGFQTADSIRQTVITKDYLETLNIRAGSVSADDIVGDVIKGKAFRTFLDQYNQNSASSDGYALINHGVGLNPNFDYQSIQLSKQGLIINLRENVNTDSTPSTQNDYKFYQIGIGRGMDTTNPKAFTVQTRTGHIDKQYQYIASPTDTYNDRATKHNTEMTHVVYDSNPVSQFIMDYEGDFTSYGNTNDVTISDGRIYLKTVGAPSAPGFYGFYNSGENEVGITTTGSFAAHRRASIYHEEGNVHIDKGKIYLQAPTAVSMTYLAPTVDANQNGGINVNGALQLNGHTVLTDAVFSLSGDVLTITTV